jgi:uncharacterized protein (TIGR02246 family)
MMHRFLSLALLLSIVANLPAQASPTDEVTLFFTDLTHALNSRDLPAIGNSWSERGEAVTLAGGVYKGRKEIQALFGEAFNGPYKEARYEYFVQYVRPDGDHKATVDGVWKISNGGPPGYPACGIFLSTLSKSAGAWRIDVSYSSVPRPGHTADHGRTLSWKKICNE